jgi:hypothetical protein
MPESDGKDHEHKWVLASWTPQNTFGIGIWICRCSASRRVIYDPSQILIIDSKALQAELEVSARAGVWTGA